MANILHLLTSTFPACACGAHASNCALRAMERFVKDGQRNSDCDESESERRMRERERYVNRHDHRPTPPPPDLGPLVGRTRGFRTRERAPGSGGLGGVEMWPFEPGECLWEDKGEGPSRITLDAIERRRRQGRDLERETEGDGESTEDEGYVGVEPAST